MKRYEWDNDGMWETDGSARAPAGNEYVLYEEAHMIEVDRDIKTANLQLLVEAVLAHQEACERCERGGNDGADVFEAEAAWTHLTGLARSLKQ